MHDFARQGTLAGEASLPSDVDTPHSRNGSTPSSMGRLQRIGAAQLWQVCIRPNHCCSALTLHLEVTMLLA